eukprot:12007848-Alexandrium_andersonii.AAC.1
MSASLVGSEMCIRDSSGTMRLQTPSPNTLAIRRSPSRRLALMSTIPVSYTHLTLPTICSV